MTRAKQERGPFPGSARARTAAKGIKRQQAVKRVNCPHCGLLVADLARHISIVHEEISDD